MAEKIGKTRTTVYIDTPLHDAAKRLNINVSALLNAALAEIFKNEEKIDLAFAQARLGSWQAVVNKLETDKGVEDATRE